MPTIATIFDPRSNSLNSLRLLFAALVIVSHSWPVGGFGGDPKLGDLKLGEFSVAAFFAISGYLITASRMKHDLVPYFRARVLRIFPGFWVCLILTAFVAAPIASAVRGGWTIDSAVGYVVKNVTLLIRQWTVGDTLSGAPYPEAWNGPLWTLVYEFACYILIAALFAVPAFRNRWAVLAIFAAFTLASIARHSDAFPANEHLNNMLLGTYFFAGATVFMFRDQVPASPWLMLGALVVGTTSIAAGWGSVVAPLAIAYACIWIAATFPRLLVERINGGKTDISYGVYIYGWVVQQLVVLAGLHDYGVGVMVAASIVGTIPLALASWFLIEKPALRWKTGGVRWKTRTSARHRASTSADSAATTSTDSPTFSSG